MLSLLKRRWIWGAAASASLVLIAACGSGALYSGSDASDGAREDAASDATLDAKGRDASVPPDGSTDQRADQRADQGTPEGKLDAPGKEGAAEGGSGDSSADGASDSRSPDSGPTDAAPDSGMPVDAAPEATVESGIEGGSGDARIKDAAGDQDATSPDGGKADAADAHVCGVAGLWSMTVDTIVATPSFCNGFMDCTSCGILFNATASQPTATTIDWTGVTPGGTICNSFTGPISSTGVFMSNETDCSPAGDGTSFDGQIDVAGCSMTATYVYVISGGACTVTFGLTGTE